MATMTITIPDAQLARVLTAVCSTYGYTGAGGQTQAQFTKAQLIAYVVNVVQGYEAQQAAAAAQQTAIQAVQNQVILT